MPVRGLFRAFRIMELSGNYSDEVHDSTQTIPQHVDPEVHGSAFLSPWMFRRRASARPRQHLWRGGVLQPPVRPGTQRLLLEAADLSVDLITHFLAEQRTGRSRGGRGGAVHRTWMHKGRMPGVVYGQMLWSSLLSLSHNVTGDSERRNIRRFTVNCRINVG